MYVSSKLNLLADLVIFYNSSPTYIYFDSRWTNEEFLHLGGCGISQKDILFNSIESKRPREFIRLVASGRILRSTISVSSTNF